MLLHADVKGILEVCAPLSLRSTFISMTREPHLFQVGKRERGKEGHVLSYQGYNLEAAQVTFEHIRWPAGPSCKEAGEGRFVWVAVCHQLNNERHLSLRCKEFWTMVAQQCECT